MQPFYNERRNRKIKKKKEITTKQKSLYIGSKKKKQE